MDIDYISRPNQNQPFKNKVIKENNYCYICEMKGHTIDKCRYNLKARKERKDKYKRNKKQNNKWNNKGKYIGNVELNENYSSSTDEDDNVCFEEIKPLFEKEIHNIETCSEEENEDNNTTNQDNNEVVWTFDTGCSEHITNNKSILKNFRYQNIHMKCANDTTCEFKGVGTFIGKINNQTIRLDNVYYSDKINKNLISGVKLTKTGYPCELDVINDETILILKKYNKWNNKKHIIGRFKSDTSNIIKIPTSIVEKTINTISNNNEKLDEYSKNLWHKRLGHFFHDDLGKYLKLHNIKKPDCLQCSISKLKRLPHNGKPPVATRILETIHSDVMGPMNIISSTGKKFILTFIDEFSRKSWVFLLKDKKEVPKTVIEFVKKVTNK